MRVVLWCTAVVLLLAGMAIPVEAQFPVCRDVTETVPSEYMEGRYLRVDGASIEEWHEWNGYTGLQTRKCVTEYDVIIGSDTYVSSIGGNEDDPDPIVPGVEPPRPGERPPLPGVCGAGDDPRPADIIRACSDIPDLPDVPGGPSTDPNCRFGISLFQEWLECMSDDRTPTAAYVNWLQYVVGWLIGE